MLFDKKLAIEINVLFSECTGVSSCVKGDNNVLEDCGADK